MAREDHERYEKSIKQQYFGLPKKTSFVKLRDYDANKQIAGNLNLPFQTVPELEDNMRIPKMNKSDPR